MVDDEIEDAEDVGGLSRHCRWCFEWACGVHGSSGGGYEIEQGWIVLVASFEEWDLWI